MFSFLKVISWIEEQSEQFFPVMVDYNSLPADPKDLEEKLRRFREAAEVSRDLTFISVICIQVCSCS